eukprot:COSAG06_NODE_3080_length_5886_cov_10.248834_9_plen_77_part_01
MSAMSRVVLCCVVDTIWLIVKYWSILTRTPSRVRFHCPCYLLFIRPKTALGGRNGLVPPSMYPEPPAATPRRAHYPH